MATNEQMNTSFVIRIIILSFFSIQDTKEVYLQQAVKDGQGNVWKKRRGLST